MSQWRRFIVPIFKPVEEHWALLVADFEIGIICVLDSFPLNDMETFNRTLCMVRSCFREKFSVLICAEHDGNFRALVEA